MFSHFQSGPNWTEVIGTESNGPK